MKNKLRAGVIGLGMGRFHVKGYMSHPNIEMAAVADVNAETLNRVSQEFNISHAYEDYKLMLEKENLDIVSVATPNVFHLPMTRDAFEAGCHVLCEKPMAMNAEEAAQMIEAGKKANKRLMINYSFRFKNQSLCLKQQVDEGRFGDFYYGRTVWLRRKGMPGFGAWFGQKAMSGGGPLIDLGVHRLDLALWLMGYPEPVCVFGNTVNPIASREAAKQGKEYDVEDFASGYITFANGATLCLEASWASHIKEQELMETRLLGTEGGIHTYNINEDYKFETEVYYESNGYQYDQKLHTNQPATTKCSMHHFVDAIVQDKPHMAPGEEGIIVMRILDALYESDRTGKPVMLGENRTAVGVKEEAVAV